MSLFPRRLFFARALFLFCAGATALALAPPRAIADSEAPAMGGARDLAERFGPRLAGAVWIPEGEALSRGLHEIPFARAIEPLRAGLFFKGLGRALSGVPLPSEAWARLLQGPALLIWARPPDFHSAGRAAAGEKDAATSESLGARLFAPAPGVELALVIWREDPAARAETLRWLETEVFALAAERRPGLVSRRRRVAGGVMNVWAVERAGWFRKPGTVLACAERGPMIAISGDERILGELLARPAGEEAAAARPAGELAAALRLLMEGAAREKAAAAGVFDARVFRWFAAPQWLSRGLGAERLSEWIERLQNHDTGTSAVITHASGALRVLAAAPRGGLRDLAWIEGLYWPDSAAPRSRLRLVFEPQASAWMSRLPAGEPLSAAALAPREAVAFHSLRAPAPAPLAAAVGHTSESQPGAAPGGAPGACSSCEVAFFDLPTRVKTSRVYLIESPAAVRFLRGRGFEVGLTSDSATLSFGPASAFETSGREALDALEWAAPWVPGLREAQWKARAAGDFVALSRSGEALGRMGPVARGEAPGLADLWTPAADPLAGPETGALMFERYHSWGGRAAAARMGDWFTPQWRAEGEEGLPVDLHWVAIAAQAPQARRFFEALPPSLTRGVWISAGGEPEAAARPALLVETTSATGFPGDPLVWITTAAALLPGFDASALEAPLESLRELQKKLPALGDLRNPRE